MNGTPFEDQETDIERLPLNESNQFPWGIANAIPAEEILSLIERLSQETRPGGFSNAALAGMSRLVRADYALWARRDREKRTFCYQWEYNPHPTPLEDTLLDRSFPEDKGLPGRIIRSGRGKIARDDGVFLSELFRTGIRKVLGIPLRSGGEIVAVLLFGFSDPSRTFSREALALFDRLGRQVGLFHERICLEKEHRILTLLYEVLSEINALIRKNPDEKELLSETIRILIGQAGFTAAGFYFLEEGELRLGVHHITDREGVTTRHPLSFSLNPASPDARSVTVRSFLSEKPVFIGDLLAYYRNASQKARVENYLHLSFRSSGVCPIFRGGRCVGAFAIVSSEKDFFTPDIQELLGETARILSMALDNIDTERARKRSEERLRTLIETLPEVIFFKDGEGRWEIVNTAGLRLFRLGGRSDWLGKTDRDLVGSNPEFADLHRGCLLSDEAAWLHEKPSKGIEIVPNDPGGDPVILEVTKIPLFEPDGTRNGLVVSGQDITQKQKDEKIRERYLRLFEKASEGIFIVDEKRTLIDVNPSFVQITGYSREEVLGKDLVLLNGGRQDRDFYDRMWTKIERKGHWEGELWNRKKSGEEYCERLSMSLLERNGPSANYLGIFTDITGRKINEDRIKHLATHDALTDLPNRTVFWERIERSLVRSGRTRERFVVGILDLDGFKGVNDRLGHQTGDALLIQVAARLRRVLRKTDTLARLGGDEFGLLLTNLDPRADPQEVFTKIVESLRDPFEVGSVDGTPVRISGSLGLTICPPDRGEAPSLIAHADLALYRVKDRGRNGWALFQQEMEEKLNESHRLRTELERALPKGEFVLHYQPQVNMTTGRIVGVEALVRWNHPERGFLLPEAFIEVAEQSDLIASLGRFVLGEALVQQSRWKQERVDLRVSVNIGARHFLSSSFQDDLTSSIDRQRGDTPLTLEVMETETLRHSSQLQQAIERCRALGVGVVLDNFGTGQASLTSLQDLAVGGIKIAQGFVENLRESAKARILVSSLVSVCRMMRIDTIAEGVQTEEEGRLLIGMGCEIAQGYAIARPMAAESIPEWMKNWTPFKSWIRKGAQRHRTTNHEPS